MLKVFFRHRRHELSVPVLYGVRIHHGLPFGLFHRVSHWLVHLVVVSIRTADVVALRAEEIKQVHRCLSTFFFFLLLLLANDESLNQIVFLFICPLCWG